MTWPVPTRHGPWPRPTVERFGGLDYLVNNAAIFGGMQLDLLLTVDWEYLNRFLSVNLLGALNCVRACYPALKERGGGAVVNQSSTAAYLYAGFYGLAKAGVNSLTQQMAHELGGEEHPDQRHRPGAHRHRSLPDGGARRLHEADPGRVGSEATGRDHPTWWGCASFSSPTRPSWITGHVFNVDGGQVVRP